MTSTGARARPFPGASRIDQVLAVARRDLAIELSYPLALVTRAASLVSGLATFYFIAKIVDERSLVGYERGYFEFVLVGSLVVALTSVGLSAFTETIRTEQSAGTLEVLLSSPVRRSTLFMGALIVPLGFVVVETAVALFVGAALLGASFSTAGIPAALLALPPTLAVYMAVGAVSASFVILSKRGDPFSPLVTQATNFFAGALFPVAVLPDALQAVGKVLPPLYSLRVLRRALLNGASIGEVFADLAALYAFALVLVPVGALVLHRALRTARRTGTLGAY